MTDTNTSGSRAALSASKAKLAAMEKLIEQPWVKPERKVQLRHLVRAQKAVVTMREKAAAQEGEAAMRGKAKALPILERTYVRVERGYSEECPSCKSHRVGRKPPPPEPDWQTPAVVTFFGVVALGCVVFGWPIHSDWVQAALTFGAGICAILVAFGLRRRYRNRAAATPERWRCRECGLEGDEAHFRKLLPPPDRWVGSQADAGDPAAT